VVLFIALRRPAQEMPAERPQPQWLALLGAAPQASFPANLAWAGLPELSNALPSAPGWQIRYNAVRTLALRGSARLPLNIMREMLDEERQMRNWRAVLVDGKLMSLEEYEKYLQKRNRPTVLADGREVADEDAARQMVLISLRSLTRWHQHGDAVHAIEQNNPSALAQVYQAVERLTHSPNLVVRTEAQKTQQELKKG
jgi:hypothetical protein